MFTVADWRPAEDAANDSWPLLKHDRALRIRHLSKVPTNHRSNAAVQAPVASNWKKWEDDYNVELRAEVMSRLRTPINVKFGLCSRLMNDNKTCPHCFCCGFFLLLFSYWRQRSSREFTTQKGPEENGKWQIRILFTPGSWRCYLILRLASYIH